MKNILSEPPPSDLHGRLAFTVGQWVDSADVRDKVVLDIGCGFGWFELWALKNGARQMLAIDMTEEDIAGARRHITDTRATFKTGSAISIPFDNQSCDTAVSWEVIEHIPRDAEPKMFSEVHRVLRKGGHFYLSTPNRHLLSVLLDPTVPLIDHRHYKIETLRSIGEKAGFKLVKHATKAGFLEAFDMWNLYVSKWIFRRKRFFELKSQGLVDRDYAKSSGFNTLFAKFEKV